MHFSKQNLPWLYKLASLWQGPRPCIFIMAVFLLCSQQNQQLRHDSVTADKWNPELCQTCTSTVGIGQEAVLGQIKEGITNDHSKRQNIAYSLTTGKIRWEQLLLLSSQSLSSSHPLSAAQIQYTSTWFLPSHWPCVWDGSHVYSIQVCCKHLFIGPGRAQGHLTWTCIPCIWNTRLL